MLNSVLPRVLWTMCFLRVLWTTCFLRVLAIPGLCQTPVISIKSSILAMAWQLSSAHSSYSQSSDNAKPDKSNEK